MVKVCPQKWHTFGHTLNVTTFLFIRHIYSYIKRVYLMGIFNDKVWR